MYVIYIYKVTSIVVLFLYFSKTMGLEEGWANVQKGTIMEHARFILFLVDNQIAYIKSENK